MKHLIFLKQVLLPKHLELINFKSQELIEHLLSSYFIICGRSEVELYVQTLSSAVKAITLIDNKVKYVQCGKYFP